MSLTGKTILVADDEAFIAEIVSYNLTQAGASVVVRHNGQEMLDTAEAILPDLIVSDFQMPLLDGYQACVKLKQNARTQNIPVILLSARGHRLSPADLANTNIRQMFSKPFSFKSLLSAIETILNLVPDRHASAPGVSAR